MLYWHWGNFYSPPLAREAHLVNLCQSLSAQYSWQEYEKIWGDSTCTVYCIEVLNKKSEYMFNKVTYKYCDKLSYGLYRIAIALFCLFIFIYPVADYLNIYYYWWIRNRNVYTTPIMESFICVSGKYFIAGLWAKMPWR